MRRKALLVAIPLACLAAAAAWTGLGPASWSLDAAPAGPMRTIRYGDAAVQAIDLFLPAGPGPHPVALLVHGGCWTAAIPGREQMQPVAEDLARRGIAVWNIGYRRADEPGGGYPGTFRDVAEAVDRLRTEAPALGLDLGRTVIAGFSAGGHLALWASARPGIPATSPLHDAAAFLPGATISMAGVPDLADLVARHPKACGPGVLTNLAPAGTFGETSPASLPPPRNPVVLVSGLQDRTVPPRFAHDYAASATAGTPRLVDVPGADHTDFIRPETEAWATIRRLIGEALGREAGETGSQAATQRP